jgi:pyruvate/2-oxoglutarate/acetoin dehydrogenase E1 component
MWKAINCGFSFSLCACSASVVEESFYYLDAPVERICGADIPMPYAANLERLALPQVYDLTASLPLVSLGGCMSSQKAAKSVS